MYKRIYFVHSVHPLDTQAGTAAPRTPSGHSAQAESRVGTPRVTLGVSLIPSLSPRPPPALRVPGHAWAPCGISVLRAVPRLLPALGAPGAGSGPAGLGGPASGGEKCGERRFSTAVLLGGPPLFPDRSPRWTPLPTGCGRRLGGHRGFGKRPPKSDRAFLARGRSAWFGRGCPLCLPARLEGCAVPTVASAPAAGLAALGWQRENQGARGAG